MTLFLLGLPFLSYADVAETCFATSSNARCHQPNMTLFRLSSTGCWAGLDWWNKNPLRLRKIAPIARTVIDTFLCITQVNLWFCLHCDGHYSDTNELVIMPAFYILSSPSLGSAVFTLSLWPRIYSRYFFISLYDQLKYTVCPPKNSKCQPVSEFWS